MPSTARDTAIYKFEKIKRAKRKALAEHPERQLLDFGIGENDGVADEIVLRTMAEEIGKPENRGYADNGVARVQGAVARFMQAGIRRRAQSGNRGQPLHRLEDGTVDAARGVYQPGRHHADDRPGYPVAGHAHRLLWRHRLQAAALCRKQVLARPESIPVDVLAKAKLLVLCYPNSPTGATATREFYDEVIQFAKPNNLVVVQDAAHALLSFDREPNSFLSRAGSEGRRRRGAFDVEGFRHDWLADRLGVRQSS